MRQAAVLGEPSGSWTATSPVDGPSEGTAQLLQAVDRLRARPVDELGEEAIVEELRGIEQATRRLQARSSRLADALVSRRVGPNGHEDDLASRRASRQVRRELGEQLGWSPSQAKQVTELGARLSDVPRAQRALDAGELPVRHASVLADTLRFVEDPTLRHELESELLSAARKQDAVTFGRTCRRALATADHLAAERAEDRRHRRRSAKNWQTEDGFYALHGQWSGIDGETVATAIHAYRRPNGKEEQGTPEQITADAVVAMAESALRSGDAPSEHGVRPHVSVIVPWRAILEGHGVVEAAWSGPMTFTQVRRHLADCGVSRLLVDAAGVPMEAGEAVRTVPAALYRALQHRDGGCVADGCDVPAGWCQVMHLDVPYRFQGRLTLDTSALGCLEHHERFDRHGWRVTWIDRRPVIHHPDRPPQEGRERSVQPEVRHTSQTYDATENERSDPTGGPHPLVSGPDPGGPPGSARTDPRGTLPGRPTRAPP